MSSELGSVFIFHNSLLHLSGNKLAGKSNMSNNEKPNLKIGQKLVLILDNEKVVGTLFKLKETHLRLKDVHDYITK